MKKLEFILPKRHLITAGDALLQAGAPGYSTIELVGGHGAKMGRNSNMDWIDGANVCVFVWCEEAQVESIVEAMRPLVDARTGIGFISDARKVLG